MRFLIALCLVCWYTAPAFARGLSSDNPVKTESSLPSITLSYAGEATGNYNIRVSSKANRTVLAFSLRLVPPGTAQVDGHFACDGQCGRSLVLGTTAKPAIKVGSRQLSFPVGSVNGGVVVAEAAVFADGSYEGDAHAAAFLVAKLLGFQTEFERLDNIGKRLTISAGEAQDATGLRIKLDELPVSVTSGMLRSFRQWFPDLAECRQYARAMKGAMVREKALAIQSLEVFARQTSSTKLSTRVWWVSTQAQLASLSCSGCAVPSPKTNEQQVAAGCPDNSPAMIYVAVPDADHGADDLNALGEDAELDADMDSEDWDAINAESASVPVPRKPDSRPASSKPSEPAPLAAKDATPKFPPTPPKNDMPPSGVGFMRMSDGELRLYRVDYAGKPIPASMLYKAWFRDIGQYGELALHRNVIWENGAWKKFGKDDPPVGGLSNAEIAILKQVVTSCNEKAAVAFQKREVLLRAQTKGLPGGWGAYAPGFGGIRQPQNYDRTLFNGCVQQLRVKLKAASFRKADNFVFTVYHAVPGKIVTEKVPENFTYSRFFSYIAWLNDLVQKNDPVGIKEANRRKQEMHNLGLGNGNWALLTKVAEDFRPPHLDIVYGVTVLCPSSVGRLTAMSTSQKIDTADHSPQALAGLQTVPSSCALPSEQTPSAQTASGIEPGKRYDIDAHLAMLRTGFGQPAFKNFDRYVHKLYASDIRERYVPLTKIAAKK